MSYRNSEGYYDPTAGAAISRADAKARKDARKAGRKVNAKARREEAIKDGTFPEERRVVYICSPFSGKIVTNCEMARLYCRLASYHGYVPFASHLMFTQFMNDLNPEERELGLQFGIRMMKLCDEVWVFGDKWSAGMTREIEVARKLGMKIRCFDTCATALMSGGSDVGSV